MISRRRTWQTLVPIVGALALGSCLPAEKQVNGVSLYRGQGVELLSGSLAFQKDANGVTQLLYQVRTRDSTLDRGGLLDLRVANLTTGAAGNAGNAGNDHLLLSSRSDFSAWPLQVDANQIFFAMRNEQVRVVNGSTVHAGTLTRFRLSGEIVEEIPDVTSFALEGRDPQCGPGGQFYYFKGSGKLNPDLHLRNASGVERVLTNMSTAVVPFGCDGQYLVGATDRTLYRLFGESYALEPLRQGVASWAFFDARYLTMIVPENGKSSNVIFDVQTRSERTLPGDSICCMLGSEGDDVLYGEGASNVAPARLHRYNVYTGAHEVQDLPKGMADIIRILHWPGRTTSLFFDSAGTAVLFDSASPSSARVLPIKPFSPRFSDDGRYLFYMKVTDVAPEVEGELYVQDADLTQPPRLLTPPGATLSTGSFLLETYDTDASAGNLLVVFWARYGRGSADLYFSDPQSASYRVVANAIRNVSVDPDQLFGIVDASSQDLVGKLVSVDLTTGKEDVLASMVDSFIKSDDLRRVVFYVRNRYPSAQDGLWVLTLP